MYMCTGIYNNIMYMNKTNLKGHDVSERDKTPPNFAKFPQISDAKQRFQKDQ